MEKTENEYCPNCGMILEDREECYFCEWKSTNDHELQEDES